MSQLSVYKNFIQDHFTRFYPKKSIKIFVLLSDYESTENLSKIWRLLTLDMYLYVYVILHDKTGNYHILRTNYRISSLGLPAVFLEKNEDQIFISIEDRIKVKKGFYSKLIHYDNYPISYIKNGKIVGAEGNLIKEFGMKYSLAFNLISRPGSAVSAKEIFRYMQDEVDICLYTNIVLQSDLFDGIWLNSRDGLCLLVPRNILVSSFENFSLDKTTLILALTSAVLVVIVWKIISIFTHNERSLQSILFSVFELTLNLGASGMEQLTTHENIMIYCFAFGSFILASFYESVFISLMLTDSTMRSVENLEELNRTDTKFYSFYDSAMALKSSVPIIRDELIINPINFDKPFTLKVPEDFDENLVYMVTCKYADAFIHSRENYRGSNQLFDKIIITQSYQRFTVRNGFIHVNKLRAMVRNLEESGIYNLWIEKTLELSYGNYKTPNSVDVKEHDEIEVGDMGVPLVVLFIGCFLSSAVFLIEYLKYRWGDVILERIVPTTKTVNVRKTRKQPKLDSWLKKYMYKKTIKLQQMNKMDKVIKSKEVRISRNSRNECKKSMTGGYFVMKNFQKTILSKKLKFKITQVQPFERD